MLVKQKFFTVQEDNKNKKESSELISEAFEEIKESKNDTQTINQSLTSLHQKLYGKRVEVKDLQTLLNSLSQLDLQYQNTPCHAFNELLKFVLDNLYKRLKGKGNEENFNLITLSIILSALPKLPISKEGQREFIDLLLTRVNLLKDIEQGELWSYAHIAFAMAKLGMNFKEHQELINFLINTFSAKHGKLSKHDIQNIEEIWQFCIYCKAIKYTHPELDNILKVIVAPFITRTHARALTQTPEISNSQAKTEQVISWLFDFQYREKIKQEYFEGFYRLDIVIPEFKLNIEVDGPSHYRGKNLRRAHQFRDYLLEKYFKWDVIRIPHFEYYLKPTYEDKKDYLLLKLAKYKEYFTYNAQTRLEELQAAQNDTTSEAAPSLVSASQASHTFRP